MKRLLDEVIMVNSVIIFGRTPPPVGGVTISVMNLINSLGSLKCHVEVFKPSTLFFFRKYDIAHIHYSSPFKRLFGIVLSLFVANKVIFTVHGKYCSVDNYFNKISLRIASGVIVLNSSLKKYLLNEAPKVKTICFTSLFVEGVKLSNKRIEYFEREEGYKYLLVYAYKKVYSDDIEVYGIDFILDVFMMLSGEYKLVLLDINGEFENEIQGIKNIIYINNIVDFPSLLSQVDVYIRPTSMDGSSVSILEALMIGTPVIASDVVERPPSVNCYKFRDKVDFLNVLALVDNNKVCTDKEFLSSIESYLNFCNNL